MSFLRHLNPTKKGLGSSVVEAVEYGAVSYGLGYVQSRYREKASLFGLPVDLLTGVAAKAASIAGHVWGVGRALAPYTNVVGNAGIAAFCHTLGTGHGGDKAGITRLLINKSDVAKAKAALPGATILGEIPRAPHGAFLSSAELAELAR
jgi:hypothetical protein